MNKVQKKIFITIKLIVVLLVSSLILGFAVQTKSDMPPNAILYVADYKKTYFAPPCLESCVSFSYRLTTAEEVRELGYSPDKDCRDRVGFHQSDRSFTGYLFQRIGLLKPLPSRWNENGTWNY
jgi:hypothetical protein